MKQKIKPNEQNRMESLSEKWANDKKFVSLIDSFKEKYDIDEIKVGHIDFAYTIYVNDDIEDSKKASRISYALKERFGYGTDEYNNKKEQEEIDKETIQNKYDKDRERDEKIEEAKEVYENMKEKLEEAVNDEAKAKEMVKEINKEIENIDNIDIENIYGIAIQEVSDELESMKNKYQSFIDLYERKGFLKEEKVEEINIGIVSKAVEDYLAKHDTAQFDNADDLENITKQISKISDEDKEQLKNDLLTRARVLKGLLDDMENVSDGDVLASEEGEGEKREIRMKDKEQKKLNTKKQLHLINKIYKVLKEK